MKNVAIWPLYEPKKIYEIELREEKREENKSRRKTTPFVFLLLDSFTASEQPKAAEWLYPTIY